MLEVAERQDSSLVAAAARGEKDAFAAIVERYQTLVCSVAYSIVGDIALSEDVAQETFLRAWRRLSTLRDGTKLRSWLCGIARNVAHDVHRARSRRHPNPASNDSVEPPDEAASRNEAEALVWENLQGLPASYREPLVLFYREGQSVKAVAEALDLSETAVKQRLSRGRRMLRDRMAGIVEETLSQTAPARRFTEGVMAALPGLNVPLIEGVRTSAVGKAVGMGPVVAMTSLVVAGVLGLTSGLFGMRSAIDGATNIATRRYALISSGTIYGLVWSFLGLQGAIGILFWQTPHLMFALCGAAWLVYLLGLGGLIPYCAIRSAKLRELEESGNDESVMQDWRLSLSRVKTHGALSLVFAAVGSAGVVLWLDAVPGLHAAPGVVLAIAGHAAFFHLYRKGIDGAGNRAAFLASKIEKVDESPEDVDRRKRRKRGIYYAGAVFGPTAWIIISFFETGDYLLGAAMALLCAVVWAVGYPRLHVAEKEHTTFFWAMLLLGVVSAAAVGLYWGKWIGSAADALPAYAQWMAAGIQGGLYGAFAIASLVLNLRLARRQRPAAV